MKRIILITIGLIAALAIGVFAADGITGGDIIGVFEPEVTEVAEETEEIAAEPDGTVYVTENALTALLNSDKTRSEATGELEAVYSMTAEYGMTDEEAAYIANLVNNGYDLSWLLDIYAFWTTCDDDISIIKSMYDSAVNNDINGRYWEEDAYNIVTNRKHGELSVDEIMAYLDKGLSIDDVRQANVLSRNKDYTISEILDEVVGGKSMDEMKKDVFGSNEDKPAESLALEQRHGATAVDTNKEVYVKSASAAASAETNKNKVRAYLNEKLGEERTNELLSKYSYIIVYNAAEAAESENTDIEQILNEYETLGNRTRALERSVYLG